jgi:hypothetical protein
LLFLKQNKKIKETLTPTPSQTLTKIHPLDHFFSLFLEDSSIMGSKKHIRDMESRSKRVNDPTSCEGDDIQRFINSSANKSISRERGLGNDLSTFDIDTIF